MNFTVPYVLGFLALSMSSATVEVSIRARLNIVPLICWFLNRASTRVLFFASMETAGIALLIISSAFMNVGMKIGVVAPFICRLCSGGRGGGSGNGDAASHLYEAVPISLLCLETELGELLADVDKDTDDDEGVSAVLGELEDIVHRQLGEGGLGELDFRKFDFHLGFPLLRLFTANIAIC